MASKCPSGYSWVAHDMKECDCSHGRRKSKKITSKKVLEDIYNLPDLPEEEPFFQEEMPE